MPLKQVGGYFPASLTEAYRQASNGKIMRVLACIILITGAFGQAADRFEIADVHESAHTRNNYLKGPAVRGGFYEVRTATMADLISIAYGVDQDQVVGGPSWLEMDRFDITAKAPV